MTHAPGRGRGLARCAGFHLAAGLLLGTVALSGTSSAAVLSGGTGFELSGTGSGAARSCQLVLLPALTLGEDRAPRLVLTTNGLTGLSFGIQRPDDYQDMELVRNNMRAPFAPVTDGTAEVFLSSDIGKAVASGKPFFVTARTLDAGKFVSSRFEGVDFGALLLKVEQNCPFYAEALMGDISGRKRAERALSLSSSDLTFIRWALKKRFAGDESEPDPQAELSPSERSYLMRFAAESGLPVSAYLTDQTSRRLKETGEAIAKQAEPPPPPPEPEYSDYFSFTLCNKSGVRVALAVAAQLSPTDVTLRLTGWYIVNNGNCDEIGSFPKGSFYLYGEKHNSGKRYWGANDINLCVQYPGPFERVNSSSYTCKKSEKLKGFIGIVVDRTYDTYTYTFNP